MLWSPANVKVGCCELELELVLLCAEALLPADEARKSIHGTATCLPPAALLEELDELMPVLLVLELGLVLLAPEDSFKEMTANSSRPEFGLTMKSLIVPIWLPDEPFTCAPVNWLPRSASCPIRPVALRCRPLQPDWLLDDPYDPDELGLVELELG